VLLLLLLLLLLLFVEFRSLHSNVIADATGTVLGYIIVMMLFFIKQ